MFSVLIIPFPLDFGSLVPFRYGAQIDRSFKGRYETVGEKLVLVLVTCNHGKWALGFSEAIAKWLFFALNEVQRRLFGSYRLDFRPSC